MSGEIYDMITTVKNITRKLYSNDIIKIIVDDRDWVEDDSCWDKYDYDDHAVYCGTVEYLLCSEYKKYRFYLVDTISVELEKNIVTRLNSDELSSDTTYSDNVIRMYVHSPQPPLRWAKITLKNLYYKIRQKFSFENIRLFIIHHFFDKYYTPEDNYLDFMMPNSLPSNSMILKDGRNCGGLFTLVTKNTNFLKIKKPYFKLWVYRNKDDDIDIPELPNQYGTSNDYRFDYTMAFSLEPNPKPLQSYEKISKRLDGNIRPWDEIEDLLKFVTLNYDLFIEAWNTDTSKMGAYEYGFDISKLRTLDLRE